MHRADFLTSGSLIIRGATVENNSLFLISVYPAFNCVP